MNLEQITLKGATADPASGARPLALAPAKDLVARVVVGAARRRPRPDLAGGRDPRGARAGRSRGRPAPAAARDPRRRRGARGADRARRRRAIPTSRRPRAWPASSPCAATATSCASRSASPTARCGCPAAPRRRSRSSRRTRARAASAAATAAARPRSRCTARDLGAIEVRLRIGAGGVRAGVVTPPGRRRAAGRGGPARAGRRARAGDGPPGRCRRARPPPARPRPPLRRGGAFDGYA